MGHLRGTFRLGKIYVVPEVSKLSASLKFAWRQLLNRNTLTTCIYRLKHFYSLTQAKHATVGIAKGQAVCCTGQLRVNPDSWRCNGGNSNANSDGLRFNFGKVHQR